MLIMQKTWQVPIISSFVNFCRKNINYYNHTRWKFLELFMSTFKNGSFSSTWQLQLWTFLHYIDDDDDDNGKCAGLYIPHKVSKSDRITHGSTGDCRGYRARYFNSWFLGMRRVPMWWMAWHRRTDFCSILIGRIRTNSVVRPRLSSADPPSWCQALIRSTCIRMLRNWKRWTVQNDRRIGSIFKYHLV